MVRTWEAPIYRREFTEKLENATTADSLFVYNNNDYHYIVIFILTVSHTNPKPFWTQRRRVSR